MSKPVVAWTVGAIGVVHLALTPLLFPEAVRGVIADGVIGSIESDPAEVDRRGNAFWYATAGVSLLLLAALIGSLERRSARLPRYIGWAFAALTAWGVTFMPRSGFWAFLAPAILTRVRSR